MINLNGRLTVTERAAKEMRIKAYLSDLVERVAALVPVMLVLVIASESNPGAEKKDWIASSLRSSQ